MISAMIPAHRKKKNDVIRYRCPMILWSVEDSQKARMFPLRSVRGVWMTRACCSVVLTACSKKTSTPPAGRLWGPVRQPLVFSSPLRPLG